MTEFQSKDPLHGITLEMSPQSTGAAIWLGRVGKTDPNPLF